MTSDPVYLQLERWLLAELANRRWQPGERLPSVRRLCQDRQVSKATVLHAYSRLEASGRIQARERAGYFVCHEKSSAATPDRPALARPPLPAPVNVSQLFSDLMRRGAAFDLLPRNRQTESLEPGLQILNRCIGRALRQQKGAAHQHYDEPTGHLPLRQQLALRYQRDGCPMQAEDLCITSGCQHALFLALMACCRKGDLVAVESPGFYGVLQLLEQLELRVLEIPSSPVSGMDMDWLEQAASRWPIKACVVTPAFATPTGALMPDSHRSRLLKLAERLDFTIIEDDIYRELGFHSRPLPLKALDHNERVILCGSFSKSLSRDLRLGWIHAGRWQAEVEHLKLVTQLAGSQFLQQGLTRFLQEGHHDRHLRQRTRLLQDQQQQLVNALQQAPAPLAFTQPQGGLCLWAEWSGPVDTLALYRPALDAGLVITPGPLFSASGQFRQALRLSFSQPFDSRRREALQRLKHLLHSRTPD